MSAGGWHTCGLRTDGTVECWGLRRLPSFPGCSADSDGDGILDDGDGSGVDGDAPCTGGNTLNCDDNCAATVNPDQADTDLDGVGGLCDLCASDDPGNIMWKPRLTFSECYFPYCDNLLRLKAMFTVPAPVSPPLDPVANGIEIAVLNRWGRSALAEAYTNIIVAGGGLTELEDGGLADPSGFMWTRAGPLPIMVSAR